MKDLPDLESTSPFDECGECLHGHDQKVFATHTEQKHNLSEVVLNDFTRLPKSFKSPCPACNVHCRNEPLATDTVFSDTLIIGTVFSDILIFIIVFSDALDDAEIDM